MTRVHIPKLGLENPYDVKVHYSGNAIYLTQEDHRETPDPDFFIELTVQDAIKLCTQLREAIENFSSHLAEAKQEAGL